MNKQLGYQSLLCLLLIGCATPTPKKNIDLTPINPPSSQGTLGSSSTVSSTAISKTPDKNSPIAKSKEDSKTQELHYAESVAVVLKSNEDSEVKKSISNEASSAERQEIAKAIEKTEKEVQQIITKEQAPVITATSASTAPLEDISSDIDTAITNLSAIAKNDTVQSKQTEKAQELTSVKEIPVSVSNDHKTEEARVRAEAVLRGEKIQDDNKFAPRHVGSVSGEKALGWLKNGNRRFVSGKLRADGQAAKDRLRTADQQAPHAAIVTCSDSRMIPELIFDQKIGEIYTVRVVDLSVALNVQASLDFAINSLGTNLVVLLGSETCGNNVKLEFLYNQLLEKSQILQQAVINNEVRVIQGFYDLRSGEVLLK